MGLSSCQKEIEYRLDTEFIFENQSDKTISFAINDPNSSRNEISLLSNTSDIIRLIPSEGTKDPNPNTCCQGLLHSVLDGSDKGSIIIKYDNLKCIVEVPANIANYKSEKISERFFRYTFTFTNEVLDHVSDCQ